ncbi:hypothetical protein EC973_007250 [Apophysomyces ossiformis]|uniref:Uncharacterized protein n=1 Tax=Apophysomyces ossiformis TaxID=679940 RepID=A0A8H7EPY5_9FUNG|nr:hypothetical protein EC973_007250 [Apophysomyces ossiformis]
MLSSPTEVAAGFLKIKLITANDNPTFDWIPFHSSNWDPVEEHRPTCKLIHALQRAGRIRALCRLTHERVLLVYVYLVIAPIPSTLSAMGPNGQHFLDFLSLLDRCDAKTLTNSATTSTTSVFRSVEAKSLLDIFIAMPSPQPGDLKRGDPETLQFLDGFLKEGHIGGMKTELYGYQKRSLWKMLQREIAPGWIHAPEVVELVSADNIPYYFNQLSYTLTTIPSMEPDVGGGIICEDMLIADRPPNVQKGTGKTCICLSAIMATRHLPNPLDVNLKTDLLASVNGTNVKPLWAIAADQALRYMLNWEFHNVNYSEDIIEILRKYPAYYEWSDIPPSFYERARRRDIDIPVLRVYASCSTLVVGKYHAVNDKHDEKRTSTHFITVPDNLVSQWMGEIYKHIEDGEIKFVILDDNKKQIPDPLQLLQCHLVLISQSRFSYENVAGGLEFQGIPRICRCPYIGASRVRNCQCSDPMANEAYVSPLLQVHWKRVIVDEGHRLSSKNRLSELSAKLFANWKWVCTGTPTQNLTESATVLTRHESQTDDLNRLGTLIGKVLNLQPFGTNQKLWNQLITKPFMKGKPWAITSVSCLMEQVMIRNRRCDVEKDVKLPPLYRKQVFLEFDYYQWIAHNCQIAMIGLNAILSRREGPDYLFSKNNKRALHETAHNIWQSCLWHSIDLRWLKASFENCYEKIKAVDNGLEDYGDDEPTLRQIKEVLQHALNDQMFMSMMSSHSPSLIVLGLPRVFMEQWSWLGGQRGAYVGENHCIIQFETIKNLIRETANAADTDELYVYDGVHRSLKRLHGTREKENNSQEVHQLPLTYYTKNAFSDARIACSTSSKINYLLNQICQYHRTEKCIIFSQHYNEIQEIYAALHLAHIRVLMYLDSHMSNAKRSQTILTFNTSDNANVIVMAVQKAAYGIDLSSATRVYFVSPVWQTAMEIQAIKRAHRIGQRKPVYVETLVIRNSIEDELLKRRQEVVSDLNSGNYTGNIEGKNDAFSPETHEYAQQEFYSDTKLRNMLNHARFVPLPSHISTDHNQLIQPLEAPLHIMQRRFSAGRGRPTSYANDSMLRRHALSLSKSEQNGKRKVVVDEEEEKQTDDGDAPLVAQQLVRNVSVEDLSFKRRKKKSVRFADAETEALCNKLEQDQGFNNVYSSSSL